MALFTSKTAVLAVVVQLLLAVEISGIEQNSGLWTLRFGSDGAVIGAKIESPNTSLGIEEEMTETVGKSGDPVDGHIKFRSSTYYGVVERDMKPGEVVLYWETFGGPRLEWEYWDSKGLVTTISPGDNIPENWFGKRVRLITKKMNSQIIGILVHSASPDEWGIKIENAANGPVLFTKEGMKELQCLK